MRPPVALLPAGERICEPGSFKVGVAGGWFQDRATGEARLLTCAHLLTPPALRAFAAPPTERAWSRRGPEAEPDGAAPVRSLAGEGARLSLAASGRIVATVLAAGRRDPHGRVRSLDACIAAPEPSSESAHLATPEAAPRVARARVGTRVTLVLRDALGLEGVIVATDYASGWYGSRREILVAPLEGTRVSRSGDSGALLIESDSGDAVGMHVGEVRGVTVDGVRYDVLACAHHLLDVLELFDLAPLR